MSVGDEMDFYNLVGYYIEQIGSEMLLFFFELDEVFDFFESVSLVEIQEDSVQIVLKAFLSFFEFGSFKI